MSELAETIQPLRDIRQRADLPALDTFIFVDQQVSNVDRAARLRTLALELDLTASHIRRVLEESTL